MYLNPFRWTFRSQCLAGFAACAALIGFAIYSQFAWGLEPCPMCIFQRLAFADLGLVVVVRLHLVGMRHRDRRLVAGAVHGVGRIGRRVA